jgi:hypothetical protein
MEGASLAYVSDGCLRVRREMNGGRDTRMHHSTVEHPSCFGVGLAANVRTRVPPRQQQLLCPSLHRGSGRVRPPHQHTARTSDVSRVFRHVELVGPGDLVQRDCRAD